MTRDDNIIEARKLF